MKLDTLPVLRARHTLVKVAPGADASTVEAVGLRLTSIWASIVAGAEEASACEGGHLGYFPRGRMVPQFEAAAFAPAPGAISHSHNRIERIDDD